MNILQRMEEIKKQLQENLKGSEFVKREAIVCLLQRMQILTKFVEQLSGFVQIRQSIAAGILQALRDDTRTTARERLQLIAERKECVERTEFLQTQWQEALEERRELIQQYIRESAQYKQLATLNGKKITARRITLFPGEEDVEIVYPEPMTI